MRQPGDGQETAMRLRFGGKAGQEVPTLEQSLQEMQAALAHKQKLWAEQLAKDPAAFAHLEHEIHLAFQQFADRCAAGLLAHAAAQPTCADAAKKK
jgi:hypothetical protein